MRNFIYLCDHYINMNKVVDFEFDNENLTITVYFENSKFDLECIYYSASSYSFAKGRVLGHIQGKDKK